MAPQGILYGLGFPGFQSLGSTSEFWNVEPLNFAINSESQDIEARKQVKGVSTVSGSALVSTTYTAIVTFQALSWTALQFALGVKAAISSNLQLPDVKTARIDSAGEIADTDIKIVVSPAFTSVGKVFVVNPETETAFTPIPTGTPTAGQFRVDAAANKLIFATADAGKVVTYRQITQYSTITGIGFDETAGRFNSVSFSGICYGNDGPHSKINIPSMTLIKRPSLSLGSEATSMELEFKLNQLSGFDMPFQLVELN
jgi:hypothetical protein